MGTSKDCLKETGILSTALGCIMFLLSCQIACSNKTCLDQKHIDVCMSNFGSKTISFQTKAFTHKFFISSLDCTLSVSPSTKFRGELFKCFFKSDTSGVSSTSDLYTQIQFRHIRLADWFILSDSFPSETSLAGIYYPNRVELTVTMMADTTGCGSTLYRIKRSFPI